MKVSLILMFFLANIDCLLALSKIKVDKNYLSQHDIVYLEPDYDAFNGFPLGNGDLGGMLWFTDKGIEIQLNKIDLYDRPQKGKMTLRSAGRVKVDLGVPAYSYMHLSDFESRLSLQNAELNINSSTAFVDTRINSWVDANSNVWILDCEAKYKESLPSGAINRISLERWGSRDFGGWYGGYDKNVANGLGSAKVSKLGKDIILEEKFEGGLSFTVACRIIDVDAEIQKLSDREISFTTAQSPVQRYKILISVVNSNEAENPTEKALEQLNAVEAKSLTALKNEHLKWWNNFWDRSFVHLSDNYLENIYYVRRYLMGSSSRGKYPSPFNGGLWTTNYDHRQWVTPHHWNTQESYWGLAIQNDCDLLKPYIETYSKMMPKAKELAKAKGIDAGLLITEAHDFDGNMVSANWGNMTTNYTPASQVCKIMWEYYAYTQDVEYLRTKIYPFMREAAEFYLQFLQWDENKEEYFIFPAQPYEHAEASNLKNTITDRYMIESLFKNCISAANDLKQDKAKIKEWEHVLDHLWAPPVLNVPGVGKAYGVAFTKNNEAYPSKDAYNDFEHYHFDAHTTAVYPAGVLGLDDKDTEEYEIAKNVALLHPAHRNAITPGAIVSARLGLGDKVLERLQNSVNYQQHFKQGLFYNIDHWYWFSRNADRLDNAKLLCQRDYVYDSRLRYNSRNGGQSGLRTQPFVQCGMETTGIFATAVNEMLLQSHEGKIRIFPAIPNKFAAAFTLRAEGAFMVSSSIDSLGVVPHIEIKSLAGKLCRLQNPWLGTEVQIVLPNKQVKNVKVDRDGVINFRTEKGESYLLKPRNADMPKVIHFYGKQNNQPKQYGEAILGNPCTFMR